MDMDIGVVSLADGTPPETIDERQVDGRLLIKKSKPRQNFNWQQLSILEQVFETDPLPWAALRVEIAERLGITPRCVQVWFQNRRQKWKNHQQRLGHDPRANGPTLRNAPVSLETLLRRSAAGGGGDRRSRNDRRGGIASESLARPRKS